MNNNYSYTELSNRLTKRSSVKIENNTIAYKVDDMITIDLHGNTIARLEPDTIILYSCGWLTSTTKDRLNKIIPDYWSIYQERGQWFIHDKKYSQPFGIFADGLTFKHSSVNPCWFIDTSTIGQDNTLLRKSILKYCKGYISALKAGEIESPSAGDCMYCSLFLGEGIESTDHLISHMDERYYVPSLLYNALRWYPVSKYAFNLMQNWSDNPIEEHNHWIIDSQVYSSLKRYMFKQFGLPT